jgi:hypothetical protein
LLCWAATLALLALLLRQRYRVEALRYEVERLRSGGESHLQDELSPLNKVRSI